MRSASGLRCLTEAMRPRVALALAVAQGRFQHPVILAQKIAKIQ